jgi:hypothetical protein
MSGTIIKTKYSVTTAAPTDGSLAVGEMAYSFTSDKLFIGDNTSPTSVSEIIGGKYFTDKLDHALGTLTANSAILVDAAKKIDVLNVDNITLDLNTISTTNTNGHLILNPNGSGEVQVQADLAIVGDVTINGTAVLTGATTLGNINIAVNTISALNTNGDIILTPDGTGSVKINSTKVLVIPKGLTATRPTPGTATNGAIRYNESTNRFEGVVSGNWTGLGGVIDVDQDTYISAETMNAGSPTDDDTLRFFAAGTQEAYVNTAGMYITDQITSPIANITTANIATANVTTKLNVTTADVTFTNGIDVTGGDVDITADLRVLGHTYLGNTIGDHTVISGNLTVAGTTTTIESVTTTVTDPVMELASDSTTTAAVNDRGINFKYGDGTTIQTGFFGMDMATKRFSFQKVLGTGDTAADDNKFNAPWGDAQFNSLFLSGNQITDGTLNVKGAVDFDTTLNVDGNTTLGGTLTVASTLGVTGVTTLAALLNANGGINCDSGKFIVADTSGNVSTQGTLTVTGATVLSSTLNGVGAVDFDSTLNVDGAVTHKSTTALGSTGQMVIDAAGVMTAGTIDCGTF